MEEVSTIGLDIAKTVFQAHGADAAGRQLFSKRITRAKLLEFFAAQPRCLVAMEACGGAHHWARELTQMGHQVRLIPPAYVKPFVKRQKNDAADAEAICEAAQRPNMRFVAIKSEEQQASGLVFRTRDLLVRQRTQTINAIRGHMAEYGWVAPRGPAWVSLLGEQIDDEVGASLPVAARDMFRVMLGLLDQLDVQVAALDKEIARRAREDEVARRLMTIPGIGPIAATAIAALAPAMETFKRGRDFAAWLGLTPRQKSTGGKTRLGRTSKMGERTLTAAVDHRCERGGSARQPARRTRRLVARRDARAQAADADHRRAGEQDGADRLGRADDEAGLQSSGGVRFKPTSHQRPSEDGKRCEGGYGATVGETGPVNQDLLLCLEHVCLIWIRSANSHTGQQPRLHQQAGQMAASDRSALLDFHHLLSAGRPQKSKCTAALGEGG